MNKYWVDNQNDLGKNMHHAVHMDECAYKSDDITDLGHHPDCHSALLNARWHYFRVNGCSHCIPDCHYQ